MRDSKNHEEPLDEFKDGTGFPLIAVGYRAAKGRHKDGGTFGGIPFSKATNLIRLGPTYESFLRPVRLLIETFGWDYFSVVRHDYSTQYDAVDYGFPLGFPEYLTNFDYYFKGEEIFNYTKSFNSFTIDVSVKCPVPGPTSGQNGNGTSGGTDRSITFKQYDRSGYTGEQCLLGIEFCSGWVAEKLSFESRITFWTIDLEIMADIMTHQINYRDNYNNYWISIDDRPIKYFHFYLDDGSQSTSNIKMKLNKFKNV